MPRTARVVWSSRPLSLATSPRVRASGLRRVSSNSRDELYAEDGRSLDIYRRRAEKLSLSLERPSKHTRVRVLLPQRKIRKETYPKEIYISPQAFRRCGRRADTRALGASKCRSRASCATQTPAPECPDTPRIALECLGNCPSRTKRDSRYCDIQAHSNTFAPGIGLVGRAWLPASNRRDRFIILREVGGSLSVYEYSSGRWSALELSQVGAGNVP